MPSCRNGSCLAPAWMSRVVIAAGIYHIAFALWANAWPHLWFDWSGMARLNHPILWRGIGLLEGALGIGFLLVARDPLRHWPVLAMGFAKFTLGSVGFLAAFFENAIPMRSLWLAVVDDMIWWLPFAAILLASLRSHFEIPHSGAEPMKIPEAAAKFHLSSGESLAEASENHTLAIVFLRHFGCTFTRQFLRGLETMQREADSRGVRLVLVHMLKSGEESRYIAGEVPRIADPRCDLYRAFGLGKGDLLGLLGPRVLFLGAVSVFKGCGVGHLAGDGLQMPGVFLFSKGEIIAAQRARTASHLPDLPALFAGLPSTSHRAKVRA